MCEKVYDCVLRICLLVIVVCRGVSVWQLQTCDWKFLAV